MPVVGSVILLAIEKPAAGGRMIARLDGQIILVSGAIPGERVQARVSKVGKGVVYAETVSIDEASEDRREPWVDPSCGGCLYAHVSYVRQLRLKSDVIADAFTRIGRMNLPETPLVTPSRDEGYRMRARLHLWPERPQASFFREGTHDPCDARATRQLLPSTCDAVERLIARLAAIESTAAGEIEVSENIDASERAVHLELASPAMLSRLQSLGPIDGITGLSASAAQAGRAGNAMRTISGSPHVSDTIHVDGRAVTLRRHVLAFFQGNRYLLGDLMSTVARAVEPQGTLIDLYAGVGVFAVTAALVRGVPVVAVEGDRVAARDLEENAIAQNSGLEAVCQSVEVFLAGTRVQPATLIVDPPRTGMSREALDGAIRLRAPHVIYVSCDVATLARDARRLVDGGYSLERVTAFDLFPNTPHVETVVEFLLR